MPVPFDLPSVANFMASEFDDRGYYGITTSQEQKARAAGLMGLGQALVAGAMSNSWQGIGMGITQGIANSVSAKDAAMSEASKGNMSRDKFIVDQKTAIAQANMNELELKIKSEDYQKTRAALEAATKDWTERSKVLKTTIAQMPEGDKKKIAQAHYAGMDAYVKAGAFQKAEELGSKLEADIPEIRESMLRNMEDASKAQNKGASAGKFEALNAQNQQVLGSTKNFVYNAQGEAIPQSAIQIRETNADISHKNASTSLMGAQADLAKKRSEFAGRPSKITPSQLIKRSDEISKAIETYNTIITKYKGMDQRAVSADEASKRDNAKAVLMMTGIPVPSSGQVQRPPADVINQLVQQEFESKYIEEGIAVGVFQPGSPTPLGGNQVDSSEVNKLIQLFKNDTSVVSAKDIPSKVTAMLNAYKIQYPEQYFAVEKNGQLGSLMADLARALSGATPPQFQG